MTTLWYPAVLPNKEMSWVLFRAYPPTVGAVGADDGRTVGTGGVVGTAELGLACGTVDAAGPGLAKLGAGLDNGYGAGAVRVERGAALDEREGDEDA
jgi:hypothetical protein